MGFYKIFFFLEAVVCVCVCLIAFGFAKPGIWKRCVKKILRVFFFIFYFFWLWKKHGGLGMMVEGEKKDGVFSCAPFICGEMTGGTWQGVAMEVVVRFGR